MNKRKHNQSGAAHLVLTVVIFLAIAGGVGYLFWNNVLNKQASAPDNSQKATTKESPAAVAVKMKQGQTVGFPVTVSWTYPETWTMKKEGVTAVDNKSDAAQSQLLTLTSPSKSIEVVYELYYNGGFGGSCVSLSEGGSDGNIQYFAKQQLNQASKSYFVDAIVDTYSYANGKNNLDGYSRISGLMKDDSGQLSNVKVGDSKCKIYMGTLMQLGTNPNINLSTQIRLNDVEKYDKDGSQIAIKDIQAIKDQYAKAEYKDAVKILLSTEIK